MDHWQSVEKAKAPALIRPGATLMRVARADDGSFFLFFQKSAAPPTRFSCTPPPPTRFSCTPRLLQMRTLSLDPSHFHTAHPPTHDLHPDQHACLRLHGPCPCPPAAHSDTGEEADADAPLETMVLLPLPPAGVGRQAEVCGGKPKTAAAGRSLPATVSQRCLPLLAGSAVCSGGPHPISAFMPSFPGLLLLVSELPQLLGTLTGIPERRLGLGCDRCGGGARGPRSKRRRGDWRRGDWRQARGALGWLGDAASGCATAVAS